MGEGFEISPLPAGGSSAGMSRPYHCGNREVISASVVSPYGAFQGENMTNTKWRFVCMKTSTLLWRLCMLALAMTLVLPLLPALAEEDAGNAPQNPAVILAANPTTGYTWTVEIADEAVISVADDGIAQGDEQPLTGASGLQRFELLGKAQGYTTVTFVYARSWETEEEPVYQLVYDLSVDADLKVTVVATTFTPGGN